MIHDIRNILIGIDLANDVSQISYYNKKDRLPVTVTTVAGTDKYKIPTIVCKRYNTDKWYYGAEAHYFVKKNEAVLVDNILDLIISGEKFVVEETEYEGYELLAIFLEKALGLLTPSNTPDNIGGIMITLRTICPELLDGITKAIEKVGVGKERLFIQTYEESFYYYILNQKKELWTYDVAVFEYLENEVIGRVLRLHRQYSPVVVSIEEMGRVSLDDKFGSKLSRDEWNHQKDQLFLGLIEKILDKRPVSSAFLIGNQFDKSWAEQSVAVLCNRRRVFQGINLFTKGACYAVRERIDEKTLKEYLFESEDMIRCNIGMEMTVRGALSYVTIVQAGINWYEARFECEFILDEQQQVILKLNTLDRKEKREHVIALPDLPHRPNKTTRLHFKLQFVSRTTCHIEIEDLGFGELYPASHKVWTDTIEL